MNYNSISRLGIKSCRVVARDISINGWSSQYKCSRVASTILSVITNRNGSRFFSSKSIKLSGIYPPIVTPFKSDGKLNIDLLAENIKQWETISFTGYVLLGSNGENALLANDEKIQLMTHLKYLTDKPVLAGSGCESTYQTLELSKGLAKAGADALLVVTPSYYKGRMTNDALINHYTKVADNSPIPVILYSVPANTGIDLPLAVASQLAKHPNIIGMKDSDGNITKLASIVHATAKEDFAVIAGSAGFLLPALAIGCTAGICALANTLGEDCCRLVELYSKGRMDDARELQYRLIAPNTAVTKTFGVAGLKHSMDLFGYQGGHVRPPLLPLRDEEKEQVARAFTSEGFVISSAAEAE